MKTKKIIIGVIIIVILGGIITLLIVNNKEKKYVKFSNYLSTMSSDFNNYKMTNANIESYNKLIKSCANAIKNNEGSKINYLENKFENLNETVIKENTQWINEEFESIENYNELSLNGTEKDVIQNKIKNAKALVKENDFIKAGTEIEDVKTLISEDMLNKQKKVNYNKLLKANELMDRGELKGAQNILNTISYTTLTPWNQSEYNYLRKLLDHEFINRGEVVTH